jgi:dihydroneopterin aldolase
MFGRSRRRRYRGGPTVEFERFTERARRVVVLAQEEARSFNHNYVGTEHLLLGLLREKDGVAGRALNSVGVRLGAVRERVEGIVGYGEGELGSQTPFTPRSKKIFELALRESMQLGHDYIGTEHLLLGLVRESEGVAARVLNDLGVDPDGLRAEVLAMLGGPTVGSLDPLYFTEALLERFPRFPDTMLRVKVEGLEVRVGATEEERSRTRRLLVDLDYSYDEARHPEGAETLSPEAVLGGVAGTLGGRDLPSLPEAVKRAGNYVLETFAEITDVVVTITDTYEHEDVAVSGISVSRVFSRSFRA